MVRRLVDISMPLQNDVAADPPGFGPKIEYTDHQQSLPQILSFFPGLKKADLPGGQGWAVERVQLSTHNGTHLDAPWHYHPTMNEGERAWTIDEVPLEWCFQRGVKLDFRHFADEQHQPTSRPSSGGSATHCNPWTSSSSIPAPVPPTASPTIWRAVVAWGPRRRCTCSSAACA